MKLRALVLGALVAVLLTATALAQGGPFAAQIENFWAVISTGGRTFTTLSVTTLNAGSTTISVNGIAQTSTDGAILRNSTAATAGVPVQISPRVRLCGAAWNSVGLASETDCWYLENLPQTVAGTTTTNLVFSNTINAGGAVTGPTFLSNGNVTTTGSLQVGATQTFVFNGRARSQSPADSQYNITNNGQTVGIGFDVATDSTLKIRTRAQNAYGTVDALNHQMSGLSLIASSANKLVQVEDSAAATGLELNGGTPTLGTCTGGTMVSGSHNSAGEVTGNTSGSCIINFGTPNFTNTPFCFINDETALIAVRVSARSNSSITVTGAGNGDAFQFACIGRIGT